MHPYMLRFYCGLDPCFPPKKSKGGLHFPLKGDDFETAADCVWILERHADFISFLPVKSQNVNLIDGWVRLLFHYSIKTANSTGFSRQGMMKTLKRQRYVLEVNMIC